MFQRILVVINRFILNYIYKANCMIGNTTDDTKNHLWFTIYLRKCINDFLSLTLVTHDVIAQLHYNCG